jgi:hypothetical protein
MLLLLHTHIHTRIHTYAYIHKRMHAHTHVQLKALLRDMLLGQGGEEQNGQRHGEGLQRLIHAMQGKDAQRAQAREGGWASPPQQYQQPQAHGVMRLRVRGAVCDLTRSKCLAINQ